MICEKIDCHKIPVLIFLGAGVCSREWMENHDARYDSQRLVMEYLMDRNNCKFPVVAQQENVPGSILHQVDEVRLKKWEKKPDKEIQSIQSK